MAKLASYSGVKPETVRDSRGTVFCKLTPAPFGYGRDAQLDEVPAPFMIAQEPVSRAEFLWFVEKSAYDYDDYSRQLMDIIAPHDDCPASPVSWLDAKTYIRWLRQQTKEYYSLPLDKEWEYAARGQFGMAYPWGTVTPTASHALFSTAESPCYQTGQRGQRPDGQSPGGCNDMVGNVWEWTLDSYDDENLIHGLRGGSCMDGIDTCRCTSRRYVVSPEERVPYAGFRLTYLPGDMLAAYREAIAGASYEERTVVSEPNATLQVKMMDGRPAFKNH